MRVEHGNAWKAWVIGLSLMFGAALSVRLFVTGLSRLEHSYRASQLRTQTMIQALPELLATPGPIALVMGSSAIERDFSPDAFDRRLRETGRNATSFNLGQAGMRGTYFKMLAERLRHELEAKERTVDLAVVEFSPQMSTKRNSANSGAVGMVESFTANIMTARQLAGMALHSPAEAGHYFSLRLVGSSPASVRAGFAVLLFDHVPEWWPGPRNRLEQSAVAKVYLAARHVVTGAAAAEGQAPGTWNRARRGELRWLFPQTEADYTEFVAYTRSNDYLEQAAQRVKHQFGDDLDIDPMEVELVIDAVRELQPVSGRVVVLVPPVQRARLELTPLAEERRRAALDRIAKESGATVVDWFVAPSLGPDDFDDLVHLGETTGRPKFSAALADELAGAFASAPAAAAH